MSDPSAFFATARNAVNAELAQIAAETRTRVGGAVGEAMAYSLEASGKRLRPALLMASYGELGGTSDVSLIAAAVEIVHTYSLVHDDLPCMDDDELRRGRATTHVEFGVAVATEAAFRMVPLAAMVLAKGARRMNLGDGQTGRLGTELFAAAGASGMVGGQVLDLEAEGRDIDIAALVRIHRMKTGALITASTVLGALAAGASEKKVGLMRSFGKELGLAFQIVDDILDSTCTSQQLGKTAGKDARQHKATFTTILNDYSARTEAESCISRAIGHLRAAGIESGLLQEIANFIVTRRS